MGIRYRKSIKVAPGVKINLNSKSASVTVGGKGYRKTFNSNGQTTTSVNLPVKGLSYTDRKSSTSSAQKDTVSSVSDYSEPLPSSKNKPLALSLCIFLGYCGAHYFYAGRFSMGILYLCTVGFFGFGWLYDIYRIASNQFADCYGQIIS